MWYDQSSQGRYRKTPNFAWYWPLFYSHSTKISRIAKLKVGRKRVPETSQSTYWSCYDTIRTQILNWSPSCRNRRVGTAVRLQPCLIPTVPYPVRVTTHQDMSGSGFWPGLELKQTEALVKTRTAAGLPGRTTNTTHNAMPKFVHTPVTLNSGMGQWPCSCLVCL